MIPTKKQMQIIRKHFRGDADALIKTAKRVGIFNANNKQKDEI